MLQQVQSFYPQFTMDNLTSSLSFIDNNPSVVQQAVQSLQTQFSMASDQIREMYWTMKSFADTYSNGETPSFAPGPPPIDPGEPDPPPTPPQQPPPTGGGGGAGTSDQEAHPFSCKDQDAVLVLAAVSLAVITAMTLGADAPLVAATWQGFFIFGALGSGAAGAAHLFYCVEHGG